MTDPAGIDELRARLRALGYLDARVDRFVLGGVSRSRLASVAVQASLRIGALAGLLLGPAAVIGLATRAPGLVTSARDGVVLALYLMVPFALAAAIVAGVAIAAGHAVARRAAAHPGLAVRARRAAMAAGLVAATSTLVYLTLWWRAAVPAGDLGAQLAALAVASAIALILGHAVTVSVLASLARAGFSDLPSGSPLSSWRTLAPLGVLAVAGAWLMLRVLSGAEATPAAAPPPLTVVPTGVRVVVIAIDGADPATLDRLRDEGRLPVLTPLLNGARAPLAPAGDRDPARLWTTIATGQPPGRHGIQSLEGRQLAGVEGRVDASEVSLLTTATDLLRLTRPTIASGDQRRLPAFWEVAARAGLRTAVVHWWATWPADDTSGIVLSDRAILRLEQGGTLAGEIAPDAVYGALQTSAPERAARVDDALAGLGDLVAPDLGAVFLRSARLDATILALAGDPAIGTTDLLTVYLPGLDILQHTLFPADGQALAPAAAAERVRAVDAYYTFLSRAVTAVLPDSTGTSVATVLVAQPGRVANADGLLAVSGAPAGTGTSAPMAVEAVAPTVLRLLGVPVAADLAAAPADVLLTERFRQSHPVRTVATYGERQSRPARTAGQPLDREMIERMRSLGYVR